MLNVSAKWQRAVMLDNDINVNCFADIVTTNGEKIPVSDSELWANGFEVNDSTSSNGTFTIGALIAGKLKIAWQVPALAMVANALGAALARPTLHITLRADTAVGEYTVPELGLRRPLSERRLSLQQAAELAASHLRQTADAAGIGAEAMEMTFAEEFNLVRGFSTVGKIMQVGVQIKPGIVAGLAGMAGTGGEFHEN